MQTYNTLSFYNQLSEETGNFTDIYNEYGDLLEAAGFVKQLSGDNRDQAARALAFYFIIGKALPAIEQFKDGLLISVFLYLFIVELQ